MLRILGDGFNSTELKALLFKANYSYLTLAILLTAIGIVIKGKRLQILANQFEINSSLWEFTKIQTISITFALITPGRAGEFTKIYLLAKDKKELLPAGTVICIFERLLDFLILTCISLILCIFSLKDQRIMLLLLFSTIALIGIFFVLFKMEIFAEKLLNVIPDKVKNFLSFFKENKRKLFSKSLIISVYSISIWCLDGFIAWIFLKSIGSENSILIVIGINAIVSIMSILTILPLGLGTMDLSALYLYNILLNVPKEKIVFILGAARFFSISTLLVMMLPLLLFQKEFIGKLYRNVLKRKKAPV